ncbi:MAG: MaoC/PaaZ C-terminal domain-containing protein [Phycisphaerae bacterium]
MPETTRPLIPADRSARLNDFELGDRMSTASIKISEADIIDFARQYDPQAIHLDHDTAREQFFGRLVGSGWQVATTTMKLMVEAKILGTTPLIGVEVDRIRFEKPLLPGDTIRAEAMVIGKRSSEKSNRGFLTLALSTLQQDNQIVMTQQWTLLLEK